jgi:chaperonin GroEL
MDNTTQVVFASEARKQLLQGMKVAADAVGSTLGPRGKTVIIQRQGKSPLVTKDGVTVAKSIRLRDPVTRMGAELILEAASQTNEVAGDGTTTATVLTLALVQEGLKLVENGYSPLLVCRGIEVATSQVMDELKLQAKQLTTSAEVAQVGTISANGDQLIGDLIAQAMKKVGRDGIITVEDAKGMVTTMEVAEGMQFDRGYVSPYFVTDPERMRAVYENAFVLVTDKKLSAFKDIYTVLEQVAKAQKGLLIIAEDFEGDAMTGLVVNRVKLNLPVVAVKAPGYGQHRQELLRDICVLTGATLISSAVGTSFDKVTPQHLGQCKKLSVDAKATTIVGPGTTKDAVSAHLSELRKQLEDVTLAHDEVTKLRTRAAKLAAGVAVVRVGGATEIEMTERRFRVEDALNATRAAVEEGIVPGGGMALYNALVAAKKHIVLDAESHDELAGANVVFKACLAPLRKIVENAGKNADVVIADLERANQKAPTANDGWGYNAATGEFVDLIKAGVCDPVKVTRTALKHAASVATTFLSLDAVIYDEPTKEGPDGT